MDREAWLLERRTGIGGSDAAIACGLHPFVSPLELYWDKVGALPFERETSERMVMGSALEAAIADVYAERFNVKLRRHNAIRRNPRYPFMLASPDRLIEGARIGVEIKNVGDAVYRFSRQWGEEGTDEVPEPYLLQCLHYCVVFDYPEWHLGALVGGNTLKRYIVRRDPELEEMMLDAEHDFWQCVEKREEPEIEYTRPGTLALVRRLYPGTNGETVTLPEEIEHWHRIRLEAEHEAKQYQAAVDCAKAHILHCMGNSAIGRLASGGEYRRRIVTRKAYEVEETTYVDLRYSKKGQANE